MALNQQQRATYLAANPDIVPEAQRLGIDPLSFANQHYVNFGQGEIARGQRADPFGSQAGQNMVARLDRNQIARPAQTQQAQDGIPTGLRGSEQALNQGLESALASLVAAQTQAREDLAPYREQGQQAFGLQAALSGAKGPEAQAQAFQDYQESPEQAYLREMGERAVTRNAAATGGLQGGNVLQELQRQGTGLAAQDFQNAFNRLNTIGQAGLGTASQAANIGVNIGGQQAGLQQQTAAQNAANRFATGQNIASAIGQTGQNIANLSQSQGTGLAGLFGNQAGNIGNLLSGLGQGQAGLQTGLAGTLAGINAGQPSFSGVPGVQQTSGQLGNIGGLLGGIGGLATGFGWL